MEKQRQRWMRADEVMSRLNINEFTLCEFLRAKELFAYDLNRYLPTNFFVLLHALRLAHASTDFIKGSDISLPLIQEALTRVVFSLDDVESLQKKHGSEKSDYENFVRKLRVSIESNMDLNFQPFKKQKETFSHASMGFHYSHSKEWKALYDIVRDGQFNCGSAAYLGPDKKNRVKFYDQNQKLLQSINKKILAFLTKTYRIEFPEKYKIFEQRTGDAARIYRPKFQIDKYPPDDDLTGAN